MAEARSKQADDEAASPRESTIKAAGGIVWRPAAGAADMTVGDKTIEVAVIHRPTPNDWTFPKGKLEPRETDAEAAIREVVEETGHRVHLGRPVGDVRYLKEGPSGLVDKVVRYWAMRAGSGSFIPSSEVDELAWCTLADARELLTFERDRHLLEPFVRQLTDVGNVLLVRHGSAGNPAEWQGVDRLRPLDRRGLRQAQALVGVLERFDVRKILSTDVVRCSQTIQPFSKHAGLQIQEVSAFSENGFPNNEDKALTLLRSFAETHSATVICSHAGVIPALLNRLAYEDQVTLPTPLPAKKASVWALSFEGPKLFSVEYFPPLL